MTDRMSQIKKTIRRLVYCAIILTPFVYLPYFPGLLHSMGLAGSFYPLAIALLLWVWMIFKNRKLRIPKNLSAEIFAIFILWIMASALANTGAIAHSHTKGISGIEKLLLQCLLLGFVSLCSLMVYEAGLYAPDFLKHVRTCVLVSVLLAGCYSMLECIGIYYGPNSWAFLKIHSLSAWIFFSPVNAPSHRLTSVCGQSSWFGMYAGFALPWLFSYVFTEKRLLWVYFGLCTYFISLTVLAISRTAYAVAFAEIFIFLIGLILGGRNIPWKRSFLLLAAVLLALLMTTTIFGTKAYSGYDSMASMPSSLRKIAERELSPLSASALPPTKNGSNAGRFGSQLAALRMAVSRPIFGVGLAQYGFYMSSYFPRQMLDDESRGWLSTAPGSSWPDSYNIHIRIAAEQGFVGLGLWCLLWITLIWRCFVCYRENTRLIGKPDFLGLALLTAIIGVLLGGFSDGTFRFFTYWIVLGLGWTYMETRSCPEKICRTPAGL